MAEPDERSERSEPYTLAVSTQKGGAGKTTVAINLAGALADRGWNVLLTDLDPQGHATEGVGIPEAYDADGPTLREVLVEPNGDATLQDVIVTAPEFDVAPANADMAAEPQLESALANSTGGENRLAIALGQLDAGAYDFVIVDCPPSLGALTDNALVATERVLIPAKATGTSKRALELLLDKIEFLEYTSGADVRPVGVVANEVRQSNVSAETVEWFRDTFDGAIPVWELRKRVALERAWAAGRSIYQHDEEAPHVVDVFDEVADHVEQEAQR
jgi:chromosome partitioning protein